MNDPIALFDTGQRPVDNLTHNQSLVVQTIVQFAEVEDSDPRLAIVLAASRIDDALIDLLQTYRLTKSQVPRTLRQRTGRARGIHLIDRRLYDFIDSLRVLRNAVCHGQTDRMALLKDPLRHHTEMIHDAASAVRFWTDGPVDPHDDLKRSVIGACVVGVLAVSIDLFDDDGRLVRKSFETLRDYWKAWIE
ncbi:hypothetical protein V7x_24670 [Crateriforma conspicua]|uniref:Uncharacterized protein n=1 Tax=Crateriforma conspicua TaxID=2527996 RepID=A0A5C6FWY8_9PLAN|nr:hypothetical protein [Crateriforma conspicua]TWU66896.1 hypothetical protein V7x_24670 [Crateriforma conspicua]